MERRGRAGIATFVMRGKEYLVAILAEKGILRAETLRFSDEVRSPQQIGLPRPERVRKAVVEPGQPAKVVDLMEVLKKSLAGKKAA
jgi:DNA end-binding protein Ku